MRRGLALAVLQLALLGVVGARYAVDRARYPRVWARVVPVDPDLPIRGRYLALGVELEAAPDLPREDVGWASLGVEEGRLVAHAATERGGLRITWPRPGVAGERPRLVEPLAFFIPEDARDPSMPRDDGREIWVEVTVPPEGPPRPIRLGTRSDGVVTPLDLD